MSQKMPMSTQQMRDPALKVSNLLEVPVDFDTPQIQTQRYATSDNGESLEGFDFALVGTQVGEQSKTMNNFRNRVRLGSDGLPLATGTAFASKGTETAEKQMNLAIFEDEGENNAELREQIVIDLDTENTGNKEGASTVVASS